MSAALFSSRTSSDILADIRKSQNADSDVLDRLADELVALKGKKVALVQQLVVPAFNLLNCRHIADGTKQKLREAFALTTN